MFDLNNVGDTAFFPLLSSWCFYFHRINLNFDNSSFLADVNGKSFEACLSSLNFLVKLAILFKNIFSPLQNKICYMKKTM